NRFPSPRCCDSCLRFRWQRDRDPRAQGRVQRNRDAVLYGVIKCRCYTTNFAPVFETTVEVIRLARRLKLSDSRAFPKEVKSMKPIDSLIDFFDRLATPRMTDTQIEIIEKKLLNLAIEGDREAARHYTDLSIARLSWERTLSPEHRLDFIDQAQDSQAWLAGNLHSTSLVAYNSTRL